MAGRDQIPQVRVEVRATSRGTPRRTGSSRRSVAGTTRARARSPGGSAPPSTPRDYSGTVAVASKRPSWPSTRSTGRRSRRSGSATGHSTGSTRRGRPQPHTTRGDRPELSNEHEHPAWTHRSRRAGRRWQRRWAARTSSDPDRHVAHGAAVDASELTFLEDGRGGGLLRASGRLLGRRLRVVVGVLSVLASSLADDPGHEVDRGGTAGREVDGPQAGRRPATAASCPPTSGRRSPPESRPPGPSSCRCR